MRTVLRRPKGLQSIAPMKTPGRASAPRRSCHSAVRLISLSWMTLEMIVPENTPFGKVTLIRKSGISKLLQENRFGSYEVIQEPDYPVSVYVILDGNGVTHQAPHVPMRGFQYLLKTSQYGTRPKQGDI